MSEQQNFVITNAKVWSWEHNNFEDAWLKVQDGTITGRGAPDELDLTNPTDNTVDMTGKFILPGLGDAHMHLKLLGKTTQQVILNKATNITELQELLKEFADSHPELEQITGVGWDNEAMGGIMPTMKDLDAVVNDRPVILFRSCWHICVANKKAFECSGLDVSSLPNVEGGSFDIDHATGCATGIARERATHYIQEVPPSKAVAKEWIKRGLEMALRSGLTSVQSNDDGAFEIFRELEENDELPLRVHLTPVAFDVAEGKDITRPYESKLPEDLLRCDRVKLFADGSLGAGTAALIGGYQDAQANPEGILQHSKEELVSVMKQVKSMGFRLETHAIGDLAAQVVLECYRDAGLVPADRGILTHAQVLNEDLISQMKELGVVADVQPSFVPTDCAWAKERLRPEILPYTYCWKTLLANGIVVAGGSDAPVENVSPFVGMWDAIYRQARVGKTDETSPSNVYLPDECLTFPEALHLYTQGSAYAANVEHKRGKLEVGYNADFVVIGTDVAAHPDKLKEMEDDLQVWVHGKKRFDSATNKVSNQGVSASPQRSDFVPGKGGDIYRRARRNPLMCRCHS